MELRLIGLDEARAEEPAEEVVSGLLDDGLVMCVAPQGSGKTFLGIHMGVHIASGRDWNKGAVRQGAVIYCIAEGVSFFPYRVSTALDWAEIPAKGVPFYILASGGDLVTRDGKRSKFVDQLFDEILRIEGENNVRARMIVFDTLNRFMPGGDENNQKEAGGLIDGCMHFRHELGSSPTVVLMHHFGKAGNVRGSTVLTGAADQVLVCHPDGGLLDGPVLWTTKGYGKRKDRDEVEQWFQFKRVPLSRGDGIPENELDYTRGVAHLKRVWVPRDESDPDPDYIPSYKPEGLEHTLIMEACAAPQVAPGGTPILQGLLDRISENLKDKPLGVRALSRALSLSTRQVYKALDLMVEQGVVVQDKETKLYSLAGSPFDGV